MARKVSVRRAYMTRKFLGALFALNFENRLRIFRAAISVNRNLNEIFNLHRLIALLAVFVSATLSGCSNGEPDEPQRAQVRWRVTVTVATPEGERSGSSVWSWTLARPTLALATPFNGGFVGQAVAVDLPDGKTLFGLLAVPNASAEMLAERQFYDPARGMRDRVANVSLLSKKIGQTRTLPCEIKGPDDWRPEFRFDCLTLASFRNINDPSSILEVNYHDAAASLGEGYAVKSISLTITDDPVSQGIQSRFPWWEKESLSEFNWERVPSAIFVGDFRTNFERGLNSAASKGQ